MPGRRRQGMLKALPSADPRHQPPWTSETRPKMSGQHITHGATAPELVSADAAAILDQLQETVPWICLQHGIVVDVLIDAMAKFRRYNKYWQDKDDGSIESLESIPQKVIDGRVREAKLVVECCAKLGLTPLDQAVLMRDASWAQALRLGQAKALAATGEALRAQRRA